MSLPSPPRQSLWLDFQILNSSTAFTHCLIHPRAHTHSVKSGFKMTHSFHSLHRCLLLAFPPLAFGSVWAHSCFCSSEGLCTTCPHLPPSFLCVIPLCPSSSTFICHHATHMFLLTYPFTTQSPLNHTKPSASHVGDPVIQKQMDTDSITGSASGHCRPSARHCVPISHFLCFSVDPEVGCFEVVFF